MKAICSSETSVDTQRTTRRYIPEDCIWSIYVCHNNQCYKFAIAVGYIRRSMYVDYKASNGRIANELERIWKEGAIV
jgi:hypothetical protein